MGDYAQTWEAFKKLLDEHDRGDMKRQAEIEPELHVLVKKLESLEPGDETDAAAKTEHDNWDGSGKVPKAVLKVTPKTGPGVLKDIDTAIKGSNPPPKAGSSSGGSSGT